MRFAVELSEYVPVAVNCCVRPFATEGLAGVTAIDWRAAAETVMTVDPVTPDRVAVIDDVPVATAVARPVALMVATDGVADAQVTRFVMFAVELSEYVPVATNCCVKPLGTFGFVGVTAIEFRVFEFAMTALVVTVLSSGVCENGTAIITVIV